MIDHLKGRERALASLGWTGREAEWIALVCLHSGVFTRAQFCHYFDADRKQALRLVRALLERRAAVEGEWQLVNGGGKTCRISSKGIYRALGVENIRHRRKANWSVVMRRLLSLDFVLEHPGMNWLPTEEEKVEFIEGLGVHSNLIPRRIYYGAVQIHPLASHLDERFINPPAPTHRPRESAPTLFAGFGIANDPTQDRGVRNR